MARKLLRTPKNYFLFFLLITFLICSTGILQAENSFKIYVSHPKFYQDGHSKITILNYENKKRISALHPNPGTDQMLYSKHTGHLYLFSSRSATCEVYNPISDTKIRQFNTGGPISDVVVSHAGKYMYIANGSKYSSNKNTVTIIDLASGKQVYSIIVGDSPSALALSPDGKYLFIADRKRGIVSVVDLKDFQVISSFYAGVAPSDIEVSWDGRSLLVCSEHLDDKLNQGASIAAVDIVSGSIIGYLPLDRNVRKVMFPDENRVVALTDNNNSSMLKIYHLEKQDGKVRLTPAQEINLYEKASDVVLINSETALVALQESGKIQVHDIKSNLGHTDITGFYYDKLSHVEIVPVDYQAELAERDRIIDREADSQASKTAFFEKAYIYRSMGDRNSEIKIYNDLAEKFSGTQTEIMSYVRMGDLCYDDLLYANSADFYYKALSAYTDYLNNTRANDLIDDNIVTRIINRMGEFSLQNDKDFLKLFVSELEKLSFSSYQIAEMNFLAAYYLMKMNETKLARRCLDETEQQVINLMDADLTKKFRDRIDLLNGEGRVFLEAEEVKRGMLIDGSLSDWEDDGVLYLDRLTDILINKHRWIDERDLSMEMRLAYSDENLYLGGIVADNSVFSGAGEKKDRVVFYLDLRDNSAEFIDREKDVDESVIKIEIFPKGGSANNFSINHPDNINPVFAGKITETGYSFEIKIPFVYLNGLSPDSKRRFGLGVELWDSDSELTSDVIKIMGWVAPTQSIEGDRDCRMFGIAEL